MSEQQQSQLKKLIARGKEKGFLTYAEVNDHLPDDIVDPEQIEDIIAMINDMGIEVHEFVPDTETLLLNENPASADDDVVAEEAAAALAAVDSEFGRTTDPVRMYMREMGTVELLTREGEIQIAKRIEEGMTQVLSALANYPSQLASCCGFTIRSATTVPGCRCDQWLQGWRRSHPSAAGRGSIAGRRRPGRGGWRGRGGGREKGRRGGEDEEEQGVVENGPDPEETARRFEDLRALVHQTQSSADARLAERPNSGAAPAARRAFSPVRLVPKTLDQLIANLHEIAERIRSSEKEVMHLRRQGADATQRRSSPRSRRTRPGWTGWTSRLEAGKNIRPC
jgi:RNA polymerase primary sigma factor